MMQFLNVRDLISIQFLTILTIDGAICNLRLLTQKNVLFT